MRTDPSTLAKERERDRKRKRKIYLYSNAVDLTEDQESDDDNIEFDTIHVYRGIEEKTLKADGIDAIFQL